MTHPKPIIPTLDLIPNGLPKSNLLNMKSPIIKKKKKVVICEIIFHLCVFLLLLPLISFHNTTRESKRKILALSMVV